MRAPSFRICREVQTKSGVRLVDVPVPAMGIDALSLHAPDEETALVRARQLVRDTRNLIAIPEAN